MNIEEHIQNLLYKHSCIVVPNFGTFLAHTSPAQHEVAAKKIFPPTKAVSFNASLSQNDGLLVSRVSRVEKKQYNEILREVQQASEDWNETINRGEIVKLNGLGTIKAESDKTLFDPSTDHNYLLSSFGLAATNAVPVDRGIVRPEDSTKIHFAPPVERKLELTTAEEIEDEEENTKWLPFLKYASIILLLVSLALTAFYFYNKDRQSKEMIAQSSNERVETFIGQATFYDETPLELPPLEIKVEKKYHVVAGAFRVKKNAEKKIEDLRHLGYDAKYIGANKYELHQVSFETFDNSKDALVLLEKVHEAISPDAWILEE